MVCQTTVPGAKQVRAAAASDPCIVAEWDNPRKPNVARELQLADDSSVAGCLVDFDYASGLVKRQHLATLSNRNIDDRIVANLRTGAFRHHGRVIRASYRRVIASCVVGSAVLGCQG